MYLHQQKRHNFPVTESVEVSEYERRVELLEASGLNRSDAQGAVEAEDMTQVKPWVLVLNPGMENESEIESFHSISQARMVLRRTPGADIMKRLADGTLSTEF